MQVCVFFCAVFSLCSVNDLVCAMYGIDVVLCAGFNMCYVQFAAANLVALLRACLASLGRESPDKGPGEGPNKSPREGPNKRLCHVEGVIPEESAHHPSLANGLRILQTKNDHEWARGPQKCMSLGKCCTH